MNELLIQNYHQGSDTLDDAVLSVSYRRAIASFLAQRKIDAQDSLWIDEGWGASLKAGKLCNRSFRWETRSQYVCYGKSSLRNVNRCLRHTQMDAMRNSHRVRQTTGRSSRERTASYIIRHHLRDPSLFASM